MVLEAKHRLESNSEQKLQKLRDALPKFEEFSPFLWRRLKL